MNCFVHAEVGAVGTCVGCGKALCQTCVSKHESKMHCEMCAAKPRSDKSKITAALLAFFLGSFGAHKFYLGQTGLGIVYLLCVIPGFLLFGIPTIIISIVAFIEFIMILVMTDEAFAAKYPAAAA
jgi:TM2 domain-containing membrane protein YozV